MVGAVSGVVMLVLTWFLAFHVGVFERADTNVLRGFADLRRPIIDRVAGLIAHLCDPKPFVCLGAVVVLAGLIRRRGRVAVAAAGIMLAANATTQILKPLLGQAHPVVLRVAGLPSPGSGSWPSGHATAAMSLALCAVLVVSARWRPFVAAAGAAFAVAVAVAALPAQERSILALYYDRELPLRDIGLRFALSESRICQIHKRSIARVRASLPG